MDMTKIALATTVDHPLFDDTTVKCTLAFYKLKQLGSKNKKLADHATRILGKGSEDIFEIVKTVYAAYVCANMDDENLLAEDEFTMLCGSDYAAIMETFNKLINPKNRQASADRSN